MERTKNKKITRNKKPSSFKRDVLNDKHPLLNQAIFNSLVTRATLAAKLDLSYGGKRDVRKSLGFPEDEDLTFDYYFNKYGRNDIASAIIDRPANKTWSGKIKVVEKGETQENSELLKDWKKLNKEFKLKPTLKKLDKLASIGQFALLLFGFNDVKKTEDFSKPVSGRSLKLMYLKPLAENVIEIEKWEKNTKSPRYGKPLLYKVNTTEPGTFGNSTKSIFIHYTRVLHVHTESLVSEVYGRPVLKPVINSILNIEKILGGDAEMFWRGARPGYTALSRDGYTMGEDEEEELEEVLDKYEHDLRRFITAQGVDIEALKQQVADPLNHFDAQLQAISAQTGIPKRILIGSERGELSSAQDQNEWLSLIQTRQEEFAEPYILDPFIERCMELNILTTVEEWEILWEDVFAPSEREQVEISAKRVAALKLYAESTLSSLIPFEVAAKIFFGFNDSQITEIKKVLKDIDIEELKLEATEAEVIRQQELDDAA